MSAELATLPQQAQQRTGGGFRQKHVRRMLMRWLWLILVLAAVPPVVLGMRARPMYTAVARLQITAPPSVAVTLFPQGATYSNLRDDLTIARNDFVEAAKSPQVRSRTIAALGLTDTQANYTVDIRQVRDSDFVDVSVEASTGELAARLADMHAEQAIRSASEVRALPAQAAVAYLGDSLQAAQAELEAAQRESTDPSNDARLHRAQESYALYQSKLNEAQMKSANGYSAQFMQVVARAPVPLLPNVRQVQMQQVLGGLGGLLAGVVLALLLESLGQILPRRLGALRRRLIPGTLLAGVVAGVVIGVLIRAISLAG